HERLATCVDNPSLNDTMTMLITRNGTPTAHINSLFIRHSRRQFVNPETLESGQPADESREHLLLTQPDDTAFACRRCPTTFGRRPPVGRLLQPLPRSSGRGSVARFIQSSACLPASSRLFPSRFSRKWQDPSPLQTGPRCACLACRRRIQK